MIQRTLLFVSLLSAACTAGVTAKQTLTPSAPTTSPILTPTSVPEPTLTPTAVPVDAPHGIEQLNLVAGWYNNVFVQGNRALSAGAELVVLDISNPAQPLQIGSTALPRVNDIYVANNHAYVTALPAFCRPGVS